MLSAVLSEKKEALMCSWKRVLLASSLTALLAACGDDGFGSPDPGPGSRNWLIPASDKLDILFVVDNSESMAEEQERLAGDLSALFDRLQGPAGLPDLHVGVITTDVGSEGSIPFCEVPGDDGALQSAFDPTDGSCNDGTVSLDGNFVSSAPSDTPGTRDTNYTGSLTGVLGCMIKLGTEGCGFEQPLEAVRLAVDNPANDGFLRLDAVLAVVFVTDEDDCSVSDPALFNPTQMALDSPLGPLASFRCFEFGVECNPDDPRALGDKLDCVPRQDSPYMPHSYEYVDFVRGLKPDPRQVVVAGIVGLDPGGPDEPLVVVQEDRPAGTQFALEPACVLTDSSGSGGERVITEAAPAVRLRAFLDEFPGRNAVTSICAEDAGNALEDVGDLVTRAVGRRWCLDGDVDLAPDVPGVQDSCQVSEQRWDGDELIETKTLEKCASATPAPGELPCWRFVSQSDRCEVEGTVELVIERAEPAASGTLIDVRCTYD
jgi:hypothetical protein